VISAPFLACMLAASQLQGLPPRVLPAIHATEGGRPGMVNANSNGSADLGLMQINTVWLGPLAQATGLPAPIVRERLIHDGCFSVHVAAAIVRMHLNEVPGDLMRAIGNYHSRTPHLHAAYRARLLANAARLYEPRRAVSGR